MMPSRSIVPLLPEWEALTHGLAFYRRVSVLPLLRFLSARLVGPAQVTAADLEAYRDAIHADRLRKNPGRVWDHLTWLWNGCVRDVADWPSITIERKSRRKIYVIPWSDFSPSLKEDVDRFLDRLSGRDLSDEGPVRPARPSTIKTREHQLRVAASALVQHGHHPQTIRSIADMLSFERYQEILRVLMGRHGGQSSPQVGQIAAFLKDVARHWLKVDEIELQRFKKIASRLAVGRRGLTTKNRERLRPFDEPETVAAFLGLPQRIRSELKTDRHSPARRKAILAQMAAAIALLQAGEGQIVWRTCDPDLEDRVQVHGAAGQRAPVQTCRGQDLSGCPSRSIRDHAPRPVASIDYDHNVLLRRRGNTGGRAAFCLGHCRTPKSFRATKAHPGIGFTIGPPHQT